MTNSGFMTRLFAEGRLTRQFPSVFSQSVSSCCIKKTQKEKGICKHTCFKYYVAHSIRQWQIKRGAEKEEDRKKKLFGSSCACHSLVSRVESGPFSINWPEESILGVTKEIEG